jgi:hypothetical protein
MDILTSMDSVRLYIYFLSGFVEPAGARPEGVRHVADGAQGEAQQAP